MAPCSYVTPFRIFLSGRAIVAERFLLNSSVLEGVSSVTLTVCEDGTVMCTTAAPTATERHQVFILGICSLHRGRAHRASTKYASRSHVEAPDS